nr:MAG TPA: hypothetical protein [Caudoviricetes sp.]
MGGKGKGEPTGPQFFRSDAVRRKRQPSRAALAILTHVRTTKIILPTFVVEKSNNNIY